MSYDKKTGKIKPFDEWANESFENPFDTKVRDTRPKHIKDTGGTLVKRARTFNAARLEVTKKLGKYRVSARSQFARGEIVEVCPVLQLGSEVTAIDALRDVVFELNRSRDAWALVLGYGSLYGHSDEPNMQYAYDKKNKQMIFTAVRNVQLGEELTINYGKDFWTERKEFGLMADTDEQPDPTVTKLLPKEVSESGEVAPESADRERNDVFNSPGSKGNPAQTGKALMGGGQS